MAGRRQKMFGPLLYSTLVLATLASLFSSYYAFQYTIDDWFETRSLARQLRSPWPTIANSPRRSC